MNYPKTEQQKIDNFDILNLHAIAVSKNLECYLEAKENPTGEANITPIEELPSHPALAHLCTAFNLSPFERHILLLCVAMELEPSLGSLCAEVNKNPQLSYPTPNLAYKIFPNPTWSAFDRNSTLIHWQLIEIKIEQLFINSPLKINPDILLYLLNFKYNGGIEIKDIINPLALPDQNLLPPSHQRIVNQIQETWSKSIESQKIPIIQLCGIEGNEKTEIATTAARGVGSNLSELSLTYLASTLGSITSVTLTTLTHSWQRAAKLTDNILLIDCDDMNQSDPDQIEILTHLIKNLNSRVIILSVKRINLPKRSIVTIDIPLLTADEQGTLWHIHLGETAAELGEYIDTLTNQFNLPATAIESACLHSLASMESSIKTNTDFDLKTALWDNCRIYARPRLDSLATRIETKMTWDDLVLPPEKKQALLEIVWHVKQKYTVYGDWGFGGEKRGLGINALFYGDSGTGKTTAAEIIAKELRLDLYRIDLSAVVSKYIGESEKNLAQIFAAAEESSVVLLFDEADSLFGKRSEVKDSRDRYANLEVSYLLQRMEAYHGLSILTTNFKEAIDSAFERRLRFVVEFPFPDTAQRLEMWQRVFPKKAPTEGLDFKKLANLAVTGANIRNIALNGAFLASAAGEAIQMKHLLQAAFRECKKEGRATLGTRNWVVDSQQNGRNDLREI